MSSCLKSHVVFKSITDRMCVLSQNAFRRRIGPLLHTNIQFNCCYSFALAVQSHEMISLQPCIYYMTTILTNFRRGWWQSGPPYNVYIKRFFSLSLSRIMHCIRPDNSNTFAFNTPSFWTVFYWLQMRCETQDNTYHASKSVFYEMPSTCWHVRSVGI